MKAKHYRLLGVLLVAGALAAALVEPQVARGQEGPIVERLFRSQVVAVKPVFAPGQEGNPGEVIGFHVESAVFEINEPIEKGVIPKPRQSGAEPVGKVVAELRCLRNSRIDKNKPMQILRGKARFVGKTMRFDAIGTAIIHWCKDDGGAYNGVRWTDFSGTMTNIEGRDAGAKGHLVGTRLLIGDPELQGQSGLIIVRFRH